MTKSRVICFDGTSPSGGFGYVSAGLLAQMQVLVAAEQPGVGILDGVTAFVGTSAGSWNALYLAAQANPSAALAKIIDFWLELNRALSKTVSLFGGVGLISGTSALLNSQPLREFLIDVFGETTTLGDLQHPVMITAVQLDTPSAQIRSWRARVFDTSDPNSPDADELVVDVALRSSAAPVLLPIYGSLKNNAGPGYIDGGMFANNPSLVAYTTMLHHRKTQVVDFDEVLLLSLSNGEVPKHLDPHLRNGMASWGYGSWMLDVCNPLVAIDLMIEASMSLTTFQCQQLLEGAFHRLNPYLIKGIATSISAASAVKKLLADPSTQVQLAESIAWMTQSGWLEQACS